MHEEWLLRVRRTIEHQFTLPESAIIVDGRVGQPAVYSGVEGRAAKGPMGDRFDFFIQRKVSIQYYMAVELESFQKQKNDNGLLAYADARHR